MPTNKHTFIMLAHVPYCLERRMCYFCDMSKRELCFCLGICAWAIAAFSQESVQQARTNRSFTTNLLAFYLAVDDLGDPRIPGKMLVDSNVAPDGLKLMARPILSDADFVAWDATNYTFVVTPQFPVVAAQAALGSSVALIAFVNRIEEKI